MPIRVVAARSGECAWSKMALPARVAAKAVAASFDSVGTSSLGSRARMTYSGMSSPRAGPTVADGRVACRGCPQPTPHTPGAGGLPDSPLLSRGSTPTGLPRSLSAKDGGLGSWFVRGLGGPSDPHEPEPCAASRHRADLPRCERADRTKRKRTSTSPCFRCLSSDECEGRALHADCPVDARRVRTGAAGPSPIFHQSRASVGPGSRPCRG